MYRVKVRPEDLKAGDIFFFQGFRYKRILSSEEFGIYGLNESTHEFRQFSLSETEVQIEVPDRPIFKLIIRGERQSGKTTELVKHMVEVLKKGEKGYCVAPSLIHIDRLNMMIMDSLDGCTFPKRAKTHFGTGEIIFATPSYTSFFKDLPIKRCHLFLDEIPDFEGFSRPWKSITMTELA